MQQLETLASHFADHLSLNRFYNFWKKISLLRLQFTIGLNGMVLSSFQGAFKVGCQSLGSYLQPQCDGAATLKAVHACTLDGLVPISTLGESILRFAMIHGYNVMNPIFTQLIKRHSGRLRQVWLQIGGKTTFGFGAYRLVIAPT